MTKAELEIELKAILNSIKDYPDDLEVMNATNSDLFVLNGINVYPVNEDGCEVEGDDAVVELRATLW